MRKRTGKRDTLDGVLTEVWAMLQRGVARFNDPFHWPVLGTTGEKGCSIRTVILRQLILPDRLLVCYTDARAPKVLEISAFNQVTWLFYHPKKKIQLRISGNATLHSNDRFADEKWASAGMTNRLNYCAVEAPGTPVDKPSSGLPDFLIHKIPTLLESEKARKNFTAISSRIDSIDWLMLSVLGNRRARFEWDENILRSSWVIP